MKQAISLFNLKKTKTQSQAQNLSQRKPSHSTWLITLVMPATNSHLSESQAAVGNPLCTNLKSKKCHLTGKVMLQRNRVGEGSGGCCPGAVLCCYILSRGDCLSEWQLLLPRALGSRYLYWEGLRHRGASCLAWTALPALMSSLNDGCHVLRRLLTSGWQPFLPSLFIWFSLCVRSSSQGTPVKYLLSDNSICFNVSLFILVMCSNIFGCVQLLKSTSSHTVFVPSCPF